MPGLLMQENRQFDSVRKLDSVSRSVPAEKGSSQEAMASLLMQAISILERSEQKVRALEESYNNQEGYALYREVNQELARVATKQQSLQVELQQARALAQEIGSRLADTDNLSVEERAGIASSLRDYVGTLPVDEVRILPTLPGGGGDVGIIPGGNQPIYSDAFLLRKMQFQKMLQELLAMIEAFESGVPNTGFPIGLIFMQLSIMVIENREMEAQELVAKQQALNNATGRFNEILFLMNQLKSAGSGQGGMDNDQAREIGEKLRTALGALFGFEVGTDGGWYFDTDGTFVPAPNSEFAKLISSLGPGYKTNPIYGMITRFAKSLHTDMGPPSPEDSPGSSPHMRPGTSFLEALIGKGYDGSSYNDMMKWMQVIHRNYYDSQLPNPPRNKDYMGPVTQSTSSIQSGITGFSGQVTLQMQQQMSDITTFSDITKKMLDGLDGLIRSINQGSR